MNQWIAGVLACFCGGLLSAAQRPNIVVIMVDDMGFSDIGCYGGEIETPHLDALAAKGVRFTQFYNTARCSPTRASLLTGLYPHQAGMGYLDGLIQPESRGTHGKLHERCVTVAEVLSAAGYHTSIAGKWHLGMKSGCVPWQRGFQRSAVSAFGEIYFFKEEDKEGTREVYLDGRKVSKQSAEFAAGEDWYSTFVFNDWGVKFIDDARQQGKPFFLYMAHGAPHFPLRAPEKEIAKYRGRYREGWDVLRRRRHQRQLQSGLVKASWPLSERPADVREWESLTDQERDRFDAIMAAYAAMIDCVDQSVGQLVAALKERGLYENTVILFLSDNGGNAEGGPDGITRGEPVGGPFSFVFQGMSWATLSNTPFRRYKHFTHEGGIATPLIVHWPAGIDPARHGKFERQPGHVIDIMATAVALAGAEYPERFKGNAILPLEGCSLLPAFKGEPLGRDRPIFWEHEGNRAVRQGPWKLVMKLGGGWELYNIEEDRTEQGDLAAKMPQMAAAMARLWEQWAERSFVDQWPDERRTDWGHVAQPEPEKITPEIGGVPFEATATVDSDAPQGVVMAQGGVRFGFALYFKEGRPALAYRNDGDLKTLVAKERVRGSIELRATVDHEKIVLLVNGREAATAASGGLLKEQPGLGLFIGLDGVHPVGEYAAPNRFHGRVIAHAVRPTTPPPRVMLTPWGERVTPDNAWREYPRPAMRRESWSSLNGVWQYAVTAKDAAAMPQTPDGDILVPFAIESALSGVRRRFAPDEALWYRRSFEARSVRGRRLLLNFEAVDYETVVWVNGREVGRNVGGNLPFALDISDAVRDGANELVLRVLDATDSAYQLHGKQRLTPKGIWYTPVSGIWQSVWLEEVPERYIRDVRITTAMDGTIDLRVTASDGRAAGEVQVKALYGGQAVATGAAASGSLRLTIPEPRLWSPAAPHLYDLEVRMGADAVVCYTGIREAGRRRDQEGHWRLTLNGEEIFHWGPLDQGWWPDGLLTPPSDEAMRSDIEFLKAAGFNMIRKHIKVEPRRYYYHCDRIGMMMWQDQVSAMAENPKWTRLQPDPETRTWPDAAHRQFMAELQGMINTLYNHPCIVQWVPFNEAWGQHRTMEVGAWTSGYDPTRLVNIASGGNWFPVGHIVDHHQYPHPGFPFELGAGGRFDDYVKVVGEFGGHGFPVEGHLWNPGARNWGYGGLPRDKQEWLERYERSIDLLAELKKQGIAAGVYTQTTDVEGEINGLLTYDRRVQKMPAERLKQISEKLLNGQ